MNIHLSPSDRLAQRAVAFMEAHLTEKLTLERIVCTLGTNRTTLNAAIRRYTGQSTLNYLRLLRLQKGERLLLSSEKSILEIAHLCGFEDENYFIRAFKKHYLQTPLQYRIAKKDAPRSPDPQREHLTVAAFEEYMKKGLGKAVLLLRQQPDKGPFKEAFLDHVSKGCTFWAIYEHDLFTCFEDGNSLREEIRELVFEQLKQESGRGSSAIPFLNLLGYRKEVTDLIEAQYAKAKEELVSVLKEKGNDLSNEEREELLSPGGAAARFRDAQGTLGRFIRPGQQRIKELISDDADLFDYCDRPPVPCDACPFFYMWDGMGKEAFFEVYEEVCRNHKNGKLLLESDPIFIRSEEAEEPQGGTPMTADEILERLRTIFYQRQWTPSFVKSFHACPEKIKREVAERILAEAPETQKAFLYLYIDEPLEYPPPVCPIAPEKLIEIAQNALKQEKEEAEQGKKGTHLSSITHRVMRQIRHPAVREYALTLLEDSEHLREGVLLLATKNYLPCDYDALQKALLSLLRKNAPGHLASVGPYALSLLANQGATAPYALLVDYFYTLDPFDRHQVVKLLLKTNVMTEKLRQECRFDLYPATRELAFHRGPITDHIPPKGYIWERL